MSQQTFSYKIRQQIFEVLWTVDCIYHDTVKTNALIDGTCPNKTLFIKYTDCSKVF